MVVLNNSAAGVIISGVAQYILGDYKLVGVWVLLLFIGFALAFGLDFNLSLVLMIPLIVVFMATGLLYSVIGGVLLVIIAFILGNNFLFNK